MLALEILVTFIKHRDKEDLVLEDIPRVSLLLPAILRMTTYQQVRLLPSAVLLAAVIPRTLPHALSNILDWNLGPVPVGSVDGSTERCIHRYPVAEGQSDPHGSQGRAQVRSHLPL